jgi:hypothetical protein
MLAPVHSVLPLNRSEHLQSIQLPSDYTNRLVEVFSGQTIPILAAAVTTTATAAAAVAKQHRLAGSHTPNSCVIPYPCMAARQKSLPQTTA